MKTNASNRRTFLQTCATGIAAAGMGMSSFSAPGDSAMAASAAPILRLEPDPQRALVPVLSWDTEAGERVQTNLLRQGTGVGLRVRSGGQWRNAADLQTAVEHASDGVRYRVEAGSQCTLRWEISTPGGNSRMALSAEGSGALPPNSVELVFPFDPRVTPTTVLPSRWREDGTFDAPLIVSAPDFGQMLLRSTPEVRGRLEGSRANHTVDLFLECPRLDANHPCTLTCTPVTLPPPPGLEDQQMWRLARRGWCNNFQPSARWGEQDRAFSAPPGVLANNVVSDPASMSLMLYADPMLWTPEVEGISVAALVRRAVEFWLEQRTHMSGEVVGYWDYMNFLDANASPVISAWDYVEATGDLAWLEKSILRLEFIADFPARRDQDFDGLVEATQSGNANTLQQPERSCNYFDAVNYGHKDAFSNAMIYRCWRCLADLERKLHRDEQRLRYTTLADRLKAAYARSLYNPETGWIANWRSLDGKLHDYASPDVNGLAIEYGLVDRQQGKEIVKKIWAKMQAAGFHRFELGIPAHLDPIHHSDYLQPEAIGMPHREDGTDTFQQYQNGGVLAGQSLHFLVASYLVGEGEKADQVLRAMLGRQQSGGFQNGVQDSPHNGKEWVTWDGQTCGYEGYLADVFYFLPAVLLREPHFRARFYRPLAEGTGGGSPLPSRRS